MKRSSDSQSEEGIGIRAMQPPQTRRISERHIYPESGGCCIACGAAAGANSKCPNAATYLQRLLDYDN